MVALFCRDADKKDVLFCVPPIIKNKFMKRSLSKQEINGLFANKKKFLTKLLIVYWQKTDFCFPRTAFAFSKKVGKSTVRHRFRRRLREFVRKTFEGKGVDFLFLAKGNLSEIGKDEWKRELKQ